MKTVADVWSSLRDDNFLLVKVDPNCPNENPICFPSKPGDVGYDLKAWIEEDGGEIEIKPHGMCNIKTGVCIKLPEWSWGDIRPRSSTFAKRQLFVMGGTIDCGYTGPLSIYIWNPGSVTRSIKNGDRLAQLVIMNRNVRSIKIVNDLPKTVRADSGFGSTGFNSNDS